MIPADVLDVPQRFVQVAGLSRGASERAERRPMKMQAFVAEDGAGIGCVIMGIVPELLIPWNQDEPGIS
jgi:hypothetical protein